MGSELDLRFTNKEKSQIINSPVIRGTYCISYPVNNQKEKEQKTISSPALS